MHYEDPFQHLKPNSRGDFSRQDPTQYGQWSRAKLILVTSLLVLPFVGIIGVLFATGLKLLASLMLLLLVVMLLLIGLSYKLNSNV